MQVIMLAGDVFHEAARVVDDSMVPSCWLRPQFLPIDLSILQLR